MRLPIPGRRERPVPADAGTGALPGAVTATLLAADLDDVSERELDAAAASVERSIADMPDIMRSGVHLVSMASGVVLLLLGGGRAFGRQSARRQRVAVTRLGTLPLPGIGEFVRLARGLGLVSVFEGRSEALQSRSERSVWDGE